MSDDIDAIAKLVVRLETDFGVPDGFIGALPREADWSFTIKTQALIEAAITQLVLAALGRKELGPAIEAANLLGRSGKLAMAQALGLLDTELGQFAERLGQLRNRLVHDVRKASFSYSEHLASLSKGERDTLLRALLFKVDKDLPADSPFLKSVSFAIWIHLLAFLAEVNSKRTAEEKAREIAELEADIGRATMQGSDPIADEYA